MAPNKTLAAQLCNEFREFLPDNAVEYFVSYYDYYQPEAYLPATDTYIEKDSSINQEIDRLRHAATSSLLMRDDVVIVASVSCIYGLGSPAEYLGQVVLLKEGDDISRDEVFAKLVRIHYERNDIGFARGKFRVRGESFEVWPAYDDYALRVSLWGDVVEEIVKVDPLTQEVIARLPNVAIYPATHFVTVGGRHRAVAGGDRRGARDPGGRAGGAGQAAGGLPPAPAHPVRHGDAARAGLLQRHRELLAHPGGPRARVDRRTPCWTSSPTTSWCSSTSRT